MFPGGYSPTPPSSSGGGSSSSSTSNDSSITGTTLMGILLGASLFYCLSHVPMWFLGCMKRDVSNGFQAGGMDLLCPSYSVAAQDGCTPGW